MDGKKAKQLNQKLRAKERDQKRKIEKNVKNKLQTGRFLQTPEQTSDRKKIVLQTVPTSTVADAPITFESFFANSIYMGIFGTATIPA